MKAKPSEYANKNFKADHEVGPSDGKLSPEEKARVLAVIDAVLNFNPDQARLYARLFKAGNNPDELERIYREA